MPSNYSDSPSMDEILERIKKALSEREAKSSLEDEVVVKSSDKSLTFEEMKELSSSREITDKIVGNLADDEIFIKPVVKSTLDEPIKILNKKEKVPSSKREDDVFVLTKSMKKRRNSSLENVDLDVLFKNIAFGLGRDLAISYLSPKIESWLRINVPDIIDKSQKK